MKRLSLLAGSVLVFAAASRLWSAADAPRPADPGGLVVESAPKNPWTDLKVNTAADQFQFAIVSDRTGGHRANVFSKAVAQVNLLQPEFVMSVGDLIEGSSMTEAEAAAEWDQFDGFAKKFEMPFFYVPGNHDQSRNVVVRVWGERYGRRYYHFAYKNCLFLCLCCENPPDGMGTIDKEQQEYAKKILDANPAVRWTFVFVHRPVWDAGPEKNGWGAVETALRGRKYTVFCGHRHHYQKYVRNGMNYFQLATTGGASRMRGVEYGEFDQVAWVTMKPDRPVVANLVLDGILPDDLRVPETDEPARPTKQAPTYAVAGRVTLDGKPLVGATVALRKYNARAERYVDVADGLSDASGEFKLSTYTKFDGAPAGEYVVTVEKTGRVVREGGESEKSIIPKKYAGPLETPLRVTVQQGPNDMKLELASK